MADFELPPLHPNKMIAPLNTRTAATVKKIALRDMAEPPHPGKGESFRQTSTQFNTPSEAFFMPLLQIGLHLTGIA